MDGDSSVRESVGDLLRVMDYEVALYRSVPEFPNVELLLNAPVCLVFDFQLSGASNLKLQDYLIRLNILLLVILMAGFGDIPMPVKLLKASAIDAPAKPICEQDLLDAIAEAIRVDQDRCHETAQSAALQARYAPLMYRERQVMVLIVSGVMNRQRARESYQSEKWPRRCTVAAPCESWVADP